VQRGAQKVGNGHESIGVSYPALRAVQDHSPKGRYPSDLHKSEAQAAPGLVLVGAVAKVGDTQHGENFRY
jgi:hypothetical protein